MAYLQKGSFLNVKSRFKQVGAECGGRDERAGRSFWALGEGKELPLEDLDTKATNLSSEATVGSGTGMSSWDGTQVLILHTPKDLETKST